MAKIDQHAYPDIHTYIIYVLRLLVCCKCQCADRLISISISIYIYLTSYLAISSPSHSIANSTPSSSLDSLLLLSTYPLASLQAHATHQPQRVRAKEEKPCPQVFSFPSSSIRSTVSGKWWWSWPPLTPFPPVKPQPFVPVFWRGWGI